MSFYRITDPKKRDSMVADYVATLKRLKQRNFNERLGDLAHQSELNETLNPIIESHAKSSTAITNELKPMTKEISDLNKHLRGRHHTVPGVQGKVIDDEGDKYFGIRGKIDQGYQLGNKKIEVDANKNIHVDGIVYKGTPGLWNLIFEVNPKVYTDEDWHNYKDLVIQTDLINHPTGVNQNSRPQQTKKYQLIKRALEEQNEELDESKKEDGEKDGEGIHFLPSSIKALFEKLKLLVAEFIAGNTTTRNEIVAVLDQLRAEKQITEKEYTTINTLLK